MTWFIDLLIIVACVLMTGIALIFCFGLACWVAEWAHTPKEDQ